MNQSHFLRYRLTLTPLSPIHVGSGNFIEPYEYDVDLEGNRNTLRVFDLDHLLSELTDRQRAEFDRTSSKGWHQVRTWLREQVQEKYLKFQVAMEPNSAQELSRTLENRGRTGQVEMLCRNAWSQKAYLPGSSIKGAIRTAVLDEAVQTAGHQEIREMQQLADQVSRVRSPGKQQSLEQQFQAIALDYRGQRNSYGSEQNFDPFRQLAISDFELQQRDQTNLYQVQIVNHSKGPDMQHEKILMFRETTQAALFHAAKSAALDSELRLFPQLTDQKWGEKSLRKSISWQKICDACNRFYRSRFDDELEMHVRKEEIRAGLQQLVDVIQENECLIRVGRHSHFECVTVGDPYSIPPRKGYGKSRSYLRGKVPLGWAKLSVSPWD